MFKCTVDQHLIFLNLHSISINKILVLEFMTAKVSQNLNSIQKMSTQWNQQLSRYVFSKVIEFLDKSLEWIQNVRKQIDNKKPSNTEQNKRVQNIWIKVWKYKVDECLEILIGKVDACSFRFYLFVLSQYCIVLSKLGTVSALVRKLLPYLVSRSI